MCLVRRNWCFLRGRGLVGHSLFLFVRPFVYLTPFPTPFIPTPCPSLFPLPSHITNCRITETFHALHTASGFATPRNPHLRARVTWNRVRSAEVDRGGRRSRVLLISGPADAVEPRRLCAYLDTKMVYQLDEVLQHHHHHQHGYASSEMESDGGRALLEFRFGSFRCQAEAARMALMREFRELGVVCDYGMSSLGLW